jgi:hypothetical protein
MASVLKTDRLLIGQGYNSLTANPGIRSVVYNDTDEELTDATSEDPNNRPDFVSYLEQRRSYEELNQALNVSVMASLGWGIYSGSASYQFLQSGSYNKYNTYLHLVLRSTNIAKVLRTSLLTEAALQRASAGSDQFLDYCGDHYVYGRVTGTSLERVMNFEGANSS